jgi:hypothetical protein
MNWKTHLMVLFYITLFSPLMAQTFSHINGSFTDPRDGQVYQTITFTKNHYGALIKRTWLAKNIRYYVESSYCYKNTDAYCEKYGRLYNYEVEKPATCICYMVDLLNQDMYLKIFLLVEIGGTTN